MKSKEMCFFFTSAPGNFRRWDRLYLSFLFAYCVAVKDFAQRMIPRVRRKRLFQVFLAWVYQYMPFIKFRIV